MLPSPYSYIYNTFANESVITVGCMDPHNSAYDPTAQVHDATKCGTCKSGYTRTDDSNCWKVGNVLVDCGTGTTYYGPKGYHQDCEVTGGPDANGLCYVTDGDHYAQYGHTYWGSKIPQEGRPEIRNLYRSSKIDGKWTKISKRYPYIYITGINKGYYFVDAQGNKIKAMKNSDARYKQIRDNCGITGSLSSSVVELSDSQAASVKGWLSPNANNSGSPSITTNIDNNIPTEPTDYSEIDGMSSQVETETENGMNWVVPLAALGFGALLIKRIRG